MRPVDERRRDLPRWATSGLALFIAGGAPVGYVLGTGNDIGGLAIAAWVGTGVLLTRWVLGGSPPAPFLPTAGQDAILPVAVLCIVSAGAGLLDLGFAQCLVPFGLACSAPVVVRLGDGAVLRFVARIGQAAGAAVSSVLFTILGLVAICLPWLVQRPLRVDPVASSGAWVRRTRHATEPSRSWSPDPAPDARPTAVRLRTAALCGVITLAFILVVTPIRDRIVGLISVPETLREPFRLGAETAGISTNDLDDMEIRDRVDNSVDAFEPGRDDPQAAMEHSPWFNNTNYYNTAQGWAFEPDGARRAANPYRLLDFRSLLLNVIDGSRASWRPPACDCRRLTVWMYGGSTTYGLNQRDDHTIASELARVAHDHGIVIDIHNRGALGHLHWMEAERFAWDLTMEAAPDMVIFYDGVNEGWATSALNIEGWGDIGPMIDPTTHDMWQDTGRSEGNVPEGPPGSELLGRPDDIALDLGDLERIVVERYDRSRALSRTAAEAHGIPIRYLWQPSRFSRPLVDREPHTDGRGENYSRASVQLMQAALPDDVIDVSDALRSTDEPLFTDDVHHNELGARLIAETIYERIGDDLEALVSSADRPG